MDKLLQGVLIAVIILGSGYLAYSFVVPTSDTPGAAEESSDKIPLDIVITGLHYQDFISLLNEEKVEEVQLIHGPIAGFTEAIVILKDKQFFKVGDIPVPQKNALSQIEQEISRCGEPCKDVEIVDRRDVIQEKEPSMPPGAFVCTADVLLCPDGSYTGRISPNCEFAPCPGEQINPVPPGAFVCTQDALLCPDGSYTGRIPPNCEFAPCPGERNILF